MFYQVTKEGLVIDLFPGCNHWAGVWDARCMSGIHLCDQKGKMQGLVREQGRCPGGLTKPQPIRWGIWGPDCPQHPLMSSALSRMWNAPAGAGCPVQWRQTLNSADPEAVSEHTPTWRQWASPSLKWDVGDPSFSLHRSSHFMNIRDFLQWYPSNSYNCQCISTLISQVFYKK